MTHNPRSRQAVLAYHPDSEKLAKLVDVLRQVTTVIPMDSMEEVSRTYKSEEPLIFTLAATPGICDLLRRPNPLARVILWNDEPAMSVVARAQLLQAGARSVVSGNYDTLSEVLEHQLQLSGGAYEHVQRLIALGQRHGLIGKSSTWLKVLESIAYVARQSAIPILLHGQTGTGKELVARAIHRERNSDETKQLLAINCATMNDEVVRSELFGHKKGSFTGAQADHSGLFAEAAKHGTTVLLDEIQALSLETQAMLLRALQEKRVRPVGGDQEVDIRNVQIITATNVSLDQLVEAGKFRHDLLHRINVVSISLPPLRDRSEDISLLAEHFLEKYALECASTANSFSAEVLEACMMLPWPGNARELENVVKSVLVNKRIGSVIRLEDLPPPVLKELASLGAAGSRSGGMVDCFVMDTIEPYSEAVEDLEAWLIPKVLREHKGNQSAAARFLGITRACLRKKIRNLNILIMSNVQLSDEDAGEDVEDVVSSL